MTERTQLKRCETQERRSSEIKVKRRVRGSSPTVREGVCLFLRWDALPYGRATALLLTAHTHRFHRHRCLQSSLASFALLSQIFRSPFSGINLHASFLTR